MRDYNIISPSIEGVLSDDHLYFEGVERPSQIYLVRDGTHIHKDKINILEKYSNDIYNLFLRKLSSFMIFEHVSDDMEATKIQALLQELIKVKKLIENSTIEKEENKENDLI